MAPGESRSSFARKIQIAPQSLLDLERGATLRWETATRVAGILGVTAGWLIDGTGAKTVEEAQAVEDFLQERRNNASK